MCQPVNIYNYKAEIEVLRGENDGSGRVHMKKVESIYTKKQQYFVGENRSGRL